MYVSIGVVRRGAGGKAYYLKRSRADAGITGGDYDFEGGPCGRWFGRLAAEMGLAGRVEAGAYGALHDGYSPAGEELSRNAGHPWRRPAFDLTHSLVKDASIIASVSDSWRRRILEEVASPAVAASLRYLESEACWSRRGRDGSELVRGGGFVGAAFDHVVARAVSGAVLDPQIHRHCVVFNATRGPDGRLRTLDGGHLYHFARSAAALASVEEAYQLQRLGFRLGRSGRSFAIVGIPDGLRRDASSRSGQIRERAGEGAAPAERDRANWATREPKAAVDLRELEADWRERNDRHGLDAARVAMLSRHTPRERDVSRELRAATARATKEICAHRSAFPARDFLELVALEIQCRGVRANDVRLHVWAELERSRRGLSEGLVYLGRADDGERWTTRELYDLEAGILKLASGSSGRPSWVGKDAVSLAIERRPTLGPEQAEAVRHICLSPGLVKCVVGGAGTGKTYMLDCARAAIEADGGRIIGTSLSARATRGLAAQGNLRESYNVRKLLVELERGRLNLDNRTFVFMDEASVTGTGDFARIVAEVARRGATLACVGDHRQHQAIEPSGIFLGLSRRDERTATLETILRQRKDEDRRMVAAFRDRRTFEAIGSLVARGRVHVGEDVAHAQGFLVGAWGRDPTPAEAKIIIASTNKQVEITNQLCQATLEARRPGRGEGVAIRGARAKVGDRVLLGRNFPAFDVCNGDLATVLHADVERDRIGLRLDDGGRRVTLPLAAYGRESVSLGFAVTSYKAQGSSFENVYLFVHGRMTDAQAAYVMGSRHRNDCFLGTTRDDAGEGLTRLVRDMGRDRVKIMAHDVETIPKTAAPEGRGWGLEHVR